MKKRVWLSVDWDFFQEERIEWDWSHAERGPIYSQIVWPGRTFFMGTDLRPLTSPNAHEPKADTFWARFSGALPALCVTDSHAGGLPYFWQLRHRGIADEIWNFDAHHDLGYAALPKLKQWAKEGRAEAGSWLYVLMKQRACSALRAVHIYPDWKDKNVEQSPWMKDAAIAKRVQQVQAKAFDWGQLSSVTVTGLFIAKSESWSPPWNDRAFSKFIDDAARAFDVEGIERFGEENVLDPRPWSDSEVEAYHRELQAFRKAGT